jgi:uncharacterized protein YdeI (YjbR/CyaY-like superfamily)
MIRFTPRRECSTWSAVNIARVAELKRLERMHPAGLAAFERRLAEKSEIYSYEQRKTAKFEAAVERRFRANAKAWKYFEARAPGYRRTATWWVISAKREATRKQRLETLMECCAQGREIGPMRSQAKKKTETKTKLKPKGKS